MRSIDFDAHNEEVRRVWEAYRSGRPIRPPMILGINVRYTMWRSDANHTGIGFERYFTDPDAMLLRQLEHKAWVRRHVPQDSEMGLPTAGWDVQVDFQNSYEAGWFGCPVRFFDGEVPDTEPQPTGEADKRNLIERGLPDPFEGGLMERNWAFYEHFLRRREEGFEYEGLPLGEILPAGLGTDGPLTVACNLRGAGQFLIDLAGDPDFAREFLEYITETTVERIRAYRRRLGLPERSPGLAFADDAIQSISLAMYRDLVLPSHRRLIDELSDGTAPNGIHLCGDATHHFGFLRDELDIQSFDTGFPVDFGQLRAGLGPDVEIKGGPSVMFLQGATPEQVRQEVRRILTTGVGDGRRLILREGNNLPPDVDLETLWAFYDAVQQFGVYDELDFGGAAACC